MSGAPVRWRSLDLAAPIVRLAASADGAALAWADAAGALFVLHHEGGAPLAVEAGGPPPAALAVAPGIVAWVRAGKLTVMDEAETRVEAGPWSAVAFVGRSLLAAGVGMLLVDGPAGRERLDLGPLDVAALARRLASLGVPHAPAAALWAAAHAALPEAWAAAGVPAGAEAVLADGTLVFRTAAAVTRTHGAGRLDAARIALRGVRAVAPDASGARVAVLLDGEVRVIDLATSAVDAVLECEAQAVALRADGALVVAMGARLSFFRVPWRGRPAALDACALAHLQSTAHAWAPDQPLGPGVDLLAKLWRAGVFPALVWLQDLLAALSGVRARPAADAVLPARRAYHEALARLADHPAAVRLRRARLGPMAMATAVGRMLRAGPAPTRFRPPPGTDREALAALRTAEPVTADDAPDLLPAGALEAWEAALAALDPGELAAVEALGVDVLGQPFLQRDLHLEVLPEAVRPILQAALRLLPSLLDAPRRERAGSSRGVGGLVELARRGNLENLLPTEHAFPADLHAARLLLGEALYYGREADAPRHRAHTWLVLDTGVEMAGDPLLLARAVALAAARAQRQEVSFSFFDAALGPRRRVERPEDAWYVIHGEAPRRSGRRSPRAVWEALAAEARRLPAHAHVLILTHSLVGLDDPPALLDTLAGLGDRVDLRLVLIDPPRPDLHRLPDQLPWHTLQARGARVALVPVGWLWEVVC